MSGASGGTVLVVGSDLNGGLTVESVLLAAGFGVVPARSDDEALAQTATERPVAVLLELDDRAVSGYLVCKLLRERHGELLPIVILSGEKTDASDRVVGLLLGADDYVVKPFDPSEVVARIRRLVARSTAAGAGSSSPPEQVENFDLTSREQQVMALLLRGLTQSEIARELVISSNTVATHIQRILLKLGVHNRAQAVAKVARAGWLQREQRPDGSSAYASDEEPTAVARRENGLLRT